MREMTLCLTLQTWFYTTGMVLNPDKSSAILLGTAQRASSYSSLTSSALHSSQILNTL